MPFLFGANVKHEVRKSDPSYDFRAKTEDSGFTGYACTFNRVDSYGTAFAPGCFSKTLEERRDDIRVLYNHNPDVNFGFPNDLRQDAKGLFVDAHIIDDGADGTVFMRRLRGGARFGLSFGFKTIQDRAATDEDQLDMTQAFDATFWDGIRVITETKLYEFSPVTFPANELADIDAVRQMAIADSLSALLDNLRENRLSDNEQRLVRQIVAAFPESGPAGTTDPPEQRSTRRLDAEIALAQIRFLTPDVMGQRV